MISIDLWLGHKLHTDTHWVHSWNERLPKSYLCSTGNTTHTIQQCSSQSFWRIQTYILQNIPRLICFNLCHRILKYSCSEGLLNSMAEITSVHACGSKRLVGFCALIEHAHTNLILLNVMTTVKMWKWLHLTKNEVTNNKMLMSLYST